MGLNFKFLIVLFFVISLRGQCQQTVAVDTCPIRSKSINLIGEIHRMDESDKEIIHLLKTKINNTQDTITLCLEMPKSDEILLRLYLITGKHILYKEGKTQEEIFPCLNLIKLIRNNFTDKQKARINIVGIDAEYDIDRVYSVVSLLLDTVNFKGSPIEEEVKIFQKSSYEVDYDFRILRQLYEKMDKNEEILKPYFKGKKQEIVLDIIEQYLAKSLDYGNKNYPRKDQFYRDAVMMYNFENIFEKHKKHTIIIILGYNHIINYSYNKSSQTSDKHKENFSFLLNQKYKNINTLGFYYKKQQGIMKRIYSDRNKEIKRTIFSKENQCAKYFKFSSDSYNNISCIIKCE